MKSEEIPVKLNSQKGVLWKQTAEGIKQKIEVDKIQAELDQVALDYCNKKIEEDTIKRNLKSAPEKTTQK